MKDLRVYKPNKAGTGAATKIQVVEKEKQRGQSVFKEIVVFFESANQVGTDDDDNAKFSWGTPDGDKGDTITVKLGMSDVGEFLTVLTGRKNFVGPSDKGLFHKTSDTQNKGLSFSFAEGRGYNFRISVKDEKGLRAISHTFSFAEAELLRVVLEEAVRLYYRG